MVHLLTYSNKRLLVQNLQAERVILILSKPKNLKTKKSKKVSRKRNKPIQFASPELEKAFLLMGKDCQDFIKGN